MRRAARLGGVTGGNSHASRGAEPADPIGPPTSRAVLAAAVLLSGALASIAAARLVCVSRDGTHYIQFAQQLAEDAPYYLKAHRSQPGYSTAILAVHALGGGRFSSDPIQDWIRCGQLIAVVGCMAGTLFIFLLTRRLFDTRRAAVAAMLAALWPQAAQLGGDVLSDMPHLALYLGAVLLVGAGLERRRLILLAAAGFLAAIGYLFRQESLALPIAAGAGVIWLWRPGAPRPDAKTPRFSARQAAAVALIAIAFVLPLIPYAVVTGRILHKKSLSELLWGPAGARPAALRLERDTANPILAVCRPDFHGREGTAAGNAPRVAEIRHMPRAPAECTAACARAMHCSTNGDSLAETADARRWLAPLRILEGWARSGRFVYSTLALIGFLWPAAGRANRSWRGLVVALIVLQCAAVQLRDRSFGAISTRYMLIPAALTLPWASAGFLVLIESLAKLKRSGGRRPLAIAGLLLIALPMLSYGLRPINGHELPMRQAGDWLRAHADPGDEVLGENRVRQAAFYSGCRWRSFTDADWRFDDLLRFDEQVRAERRGDSGADSGPRWWLRMEDRDRTRPADADLVQTVLSNPRWPRARSAHEIGEPGRRIWVIELRPRSGI